jgi:hypothetical protein
MKLTPTDAASSKLRVSGTARRPVVAPATEESNPDYVRQLRALAERLNFPPQYIAMIR